MKYSLILYGSICLMQLCILTKTTLLNEEWDGIIMWLCTLIFIFATTIFGFSRKNEANNIK